VVGFGQIVPPTPVRASGSTARVVHVSEGPAPPQTKKPPVAGRLLVTDAKMNRLLLPTSKPEPNQTGHAKKKQAQRTRLRNGNRLDCHLQNHVLIVPVALAKGQIFPSEDENIFVAHILKNNKMISVTAIQ